ncbi:MAG: radical SAM protein [Thermoplasmata archaeon]|nr:MAG: radical SAM protein [Thermoplasmata archaeon]
MWDLTKVLPIARIVPGIAQSYIRRKPCTVSFDVTYSCSLNCTYCYYKYTKPGDQLDEEAMLTRIYEVSKEFTVYHATFVGGEPTLRPRLLEKAVELFPHTWILTNGVRGFPDSIQPSSWVVALDGTEEIHDKYKGKGIHRRVVDNINDCKTVIFSNTTLHKQNHHCIEELVEEMRGTNLKYMTFSFYTPVGLGQDNDNSEFALSKNDKIEIISRIAAIRKKYPEFIFFTPLMEHYYHPDRGYNQWNREENCPVAIIGRHYGADGILQSPCAMGPSADCSQCGCGMNTIFLALIHGDIKTMKILMDLI